MISDPHQDTAGPQLAKGSQGRTQVATLLTSVFIIAICGILYELLISTMSSYFQGSSILHFSLVIGLFLSFMGVGSYLSRYLKEDLLTWFVRFEIWLSLIGGTSAVILYFAFSLTPYYYGVAFLLIGLLGSLIGIEIPILTRIVRQYENLRDAMAKVLSFDYLGALIASVAFPLILLPTLGVMRTAFIIGLLNLAVAAMNAWFFRKILPTHKRLLTICGIVGVLLAAGFGYSFSLNRFFDQFLYQDQILYSKQTPYQHLVMTRWNDDVRLFIDGNLQFSSIDEYRYHEPLVHIPMLLAQHHAKVLILGGGDGLAAQAVMKHEGVKEITLVDLDPDMTQLAKTHPVLSRLNGNSLNDPRVKTINQDAYKFIEEGSDLYDVILIDLPDPNNTGLGKLYTTAFYQMLQRRVSTGGMIISQSTSPYYAPEAFWCIHRTMEEAFDQVQAMNVYVPTFGQWGFNLAFQNQRWGQVESDSGRVDLLSHEIIHQLKVTPWADSLRYLTPEVVPALFSFDPDIAEREVEVNHLDNQSLVGYYESSWDRWR